MNSFVFLKSLYLHQFRNHQEAYFDFVPSLNFIYGDNARGKTTILEAIHYLMFGRSFRAAAPQELILKNGDAFYLEASFCKEGVDQQLKISFTGKERQLLFNSTKLSAASHLLGIIPGIIVTPDDVNIIKGSPAFRRKFLDQKLVQADPLYVYYLTRFERAMKQRNQLLKDKKTATIESWEEEMAQAAAYIALQRKKTLHQLSFHAQSFYDQLSEEKKELQVRYLSFFSAKESEIKEEYLRLLKKNRPRELVIGHTMAGPHKDDFSLFIGELESRSFASEGQQRSALLALYMGLWCCLKERIESSPLFMIDDVAMGLDALRKKRVMALLESFDQLFLTSTEKTLADFFDKPRRLFPL